jgi:hypothetical protein
MSSETTRLWQCDRCGQKLTINIQKDDWTKREHPETVALNAAGWQKISIGDVSDTCKQTFRDLCSDCVQSFVLFIEHPPTTFNTADSQTTETNV